MTAAHQELAIRELANRSVPGTFGHIAIFCAARALAPAGIPFSFPFIASLFSVLIGVRIYARRCALTRPAERRRNLALLTTGVIGCNLLWGVLMTGVQLTNVPFKGANETVMAMLANQMDASIPTSSNVLPHLATGRLRALAITTAQRSPQAPDVPTMQEAGVPGYETYSMFALFAPARTSSEAVKKIADDVAEIIMRPDVKAALADRGFEVQGKSGAEFQSIIDRDTIKWRKVIETAKIREE